MSSVAPKLDENQVGGLVLSPQVVAEKDQDDPECVCGRTQRCCLWCTSDNVNGEHDGHCPCCCCCKIRCSHVPETILLTICSLVFLGSISTTFFTWFMVATMRNILAGFYFMLILLVYIPVLMIAHVLKRRGNSSKFTTYVVFERNRL